MAPTVYLISGANRGIGLALVAHLSAQPNNTIFAGARSPSSATALNALAAQHPTKVHVIKLVSADEADARAAVAKIREVAGGVDVVVANAGVSNAMLHSADVKLEQMREHFDVNVLGPLSLFQAALPLLRKSPNPKFFIISSLVGSITQGTTFPIKSTAYGVSKAGADWLAARLWYEYPEILSLPLHPGAVDTDMAQAGREDDPTLKAYPLITTDESAVGLIKVMSEAKREEKGPRLLGWDGEELPW